MNGLSEAEIQMNLKTLKKLDPCITAIMSHSSQVQLYKYVSKNSSDGDWVQTKVAGALFVYQREAAPKYGFMIMNRNSKENMVEMVSPDLTFQNEKLGDASQGGAFLLYRKTNPADGTFSIFGIWFCNEGECDAVSLKLKDIQKVLARQEELKKKKKEEENNERGAAGGGAGANGGKLGELFKSAQSGGGKTGNSSNQQQNKIGQLFKSAEAQAGAETLSPSKNHLTQKNLPNMATIEASPPSQGGLQLMRLLSQSGDAQQNPAPNGPGAPPLVPSMSHTVGPPMIHGAPVGFQGGHPPAPGQTGPAGPTPPLEEERGATSASVLDFFAKASTQSSTSPHHQMVEASAFTSVPPPHPVAGGRLPPSTLPAPRTLLPPAGLPAHQGGMPQGVTALPISEGLSMGYIPVSLPAIQDVPGMHSVESVEAEQRRGEVAGSGSLSDLSSQLMSKLQVASSSTHKPQPTSQNQAVTLLSPQVFANSSPTAPEPTMASNRASSSPGHHQQAAYQNQMAPPYHNNLNPAQMVEALKYMLETDAHFVQRLHEAYTMSVQRRIQQNGHH